MPETLADDGDTDEVAPVVALGAAVAAAASSAGIAPITRHSGVRANATIARAVLLRNVRFVRCVSIALPLGQIRRSPERGRSVTTHLPDPPPDQTATGAPRRDRAIEMQLSDSR